MKTEAQIRAEMENIKNAFAAEASKSSDKLYLAVLRDATKGALYALQFVLADDSK